jgi:hypothetical protein
MENHELVNIEKNYFSEFHSNFSRFLNNINNINNKDLNGDTLKKIIIINKKILEINNLLETINYKYNKNKKKNIEINIDIDSELENYEKNDKSIKNFLPFLMYYRFLLETE